MACSWMQRLAVTAAMAAVPAIAGPAAAQHFDGQIISQQVVSDHVTVPAEASGGYVDGGTIDGGVVDSSGGQIAGGGAAQRRDYGQPDLFYNYYTQGYANSANAQMYISPVPVPAFVGHTFGTYQPWYPHHMMYGHTDRYHNYYDNGRGMNRTKVRYSTQPIHSAVRNFYWNKLRIPR